MHPLARVAHHQIFQLMHILTLIFYTILSSFFAVAAFGFCLHILFFMLWPREAWQDIKALASRLLAHWRS